MRAPPPIEARKLTLLAGLIALCSAPGLAHAQVLALPTQCGTVVECGVESAGLVQDAQGAHALPLVVHTYTEALPGEGRCPRAETTRVRVNVSCHVARDLRPDPSIAAQEQTTPYVTQTFEEGFQRHELAVPFDSGWDRFCTIQPEVELEFEGGRTRRTSCAAVTAIVTLPGEGAHEVVTSSSSPEPTSLWSTYALAYQADASTLGRFRQVQLFDMASSGGGQKVLLREELEAQTDEDPIAEICSQPVLDELVACSSDQSPSCTCEGEVVSGACEAAQRGLHVLSTDPDHPACTPKLYPSLFYDSPYTAYLPTGGFTDGTLQCERLDGPHLISSDRPFEPERFPFQLRSDPLTSRYLLQWSVASFLHDGIPNTGQDQRGFTGVFRRAPRRLPEMCLPREYALIGCATTDPCCGSLEASCVPAQQRDAWCAEQGDSDCDGVPDADETRSDWQRIDSDGDGLLDPFELALGSDPLVPDSDGDGLSDGEEVRAGLDPLSSDTDFDGLPDRLDPFPLDEDIDEDGLLDGVDPYPDDPDHDDDLLRDGEDPDPENPDIDGDGILDGVEMRARFDPLDPLDGPMQEVDSDGDGLSDRIEVGRGTDPDDPDSDHDGLTDGQEVALYFSDPNRPDSDEDGLTDAEEAFVHHTKLVRQDSDFDGFLDADEVRQNRSSPRLDDSDFDGLTDRFERLILRTSALSTDSDGGGMDDMMEWLWGGDPMSAEDDLELLRLSQYAPIAASRFSFDADTPTLDLSATLSLGEFSSSPTHSSRRVYTFPYNHTRTIERVWLDTSLGRDILPLDITATLSRHGTPLEPTSLYHLPSTYSDNAFMTLLFLDGEDGSQTMLLIDWEVRLLANDSKTGTWHEFPVQIEPYDANQLGLLVTDYVQRGVTLEAQLTARVSFSTRVPEDCSDGIDNDYDGLIDLDDEDCASQRPERCDDGIDNDADGLIDLLDPDCATYCPFDSCTGGPDMGLPSNLENCDDGKDNDGNGFIDCLDDACSNSPACCDLTDTCGGEVCNDGFDNDFDGLVDCADDECAGTSICIVPGLPKRKGLLDRLSGGCGCESVSHDDTSSPRGVALLLALMLGGVGVMRRRARR